MLERSIDFIELLPENIDIMLVTEDVFKLDKSIKVMFSI